MREGVEMARESAVVLLIPEADPALARWRERHDPGAGRGVPAHVTLLYPWRPAPVTNEDLNALADAVRGVAPFTLTFRDFARFTRVLYLRPDDDEPVRTLMHRVFAAFPEHPPYGGMHEDDVVPHLTIADVELDDELDPLAAQIEPDVRAALPVTARIEAVTVMEQGANEQFAFRAAVPLVGDGALSARSR
jgi:2'-5' RNA ligase